MHAQLPSMFEDKTALLLDMNSTFMFHEDRFGPEEDFAIHYHRNGGSLATASINDLIRRMLDYLEPKYPQEAYRHCFPTLHDTIHTLTGTTLPTSEIDRIIETFAYHELGTVPEAYVNALHVLSKHFTLALVVDIWAPKEPWIAYFKALDIWELFHTSSFSSDHGMVKPSPKPFEQVVDALALPKHACLVVGDSVRRDLGGAVAAGLDCVLVGGATDPQASATFPSLLAFETQLKR